MGIIRNALRKLLDREVGVIGGELDRLNDRVQDLQTQVLSFEERYERLRARVGMRVTRSQRMDPVDPREEFERLLARQQQRGEVDDYPDFTHFRG